MTGFAGAPDGSAGAAGSGGGVAQDLRTWPTRAAPRPTDATEVLVATSVPRNTRQTNMALAPQTDSRPARGVAVTAPTRPPEVCSRWGSADARGAPLARWSRPRPPTSSASSPMATRAPTASSLPDERRNSATPTQAVSSGTA